MTLPPFLAYLRYHFNRYYWRVKQLSKERQDFFVYVDNHLTPVMTDEYFVVGEQYYDWGTITKIKRYTPPKIKYDWRARGIVRVYPKTQD